MEQIVRPLYYFEMCFRIPQNLSSHENKPKEINIDVTTTENMRLNTPMLMENDILRGGSTGTSCDLFISFEVINDA